MDEIDERLRGNIKLKKIKHRGFIEYKFYIPGEQIVNSRSVSYKGDEQIDIYETLSDIQDMESETTGYDAYDGKIVNGSVLVDEPGSVMFDDEEIRELLFNFKKGKYARKDELVAYRCMLLYLGGLSQPQIAKLFGVTKQTINIKLYRRVAAVFGKERKITAKMLQKHIYIQFPAAIFFDELSKYAVLIPEVNAKEITPGE